MNYMLDIYQLSWRLRGILASVTFAGHQKHPFGYILYTHSASPIPKLQ